MFEFMTDLALSAGRILLEGFQSSRLEISHKGKIDLVTSSDLESEAYLTEKIRENYPEDVVLAEEMNSKLVPGKRTWIIDPLDGTTNFSHGFPFFSVSIALQVEDSIQAGVVYNPFFNELFRAYRGEGSFLNDSPLKVSATDDLKSSLIATGFPYDRWEKGELYIREYLAFMQQCQGVRRAGSASIDLCYLAAGRFDGFFEHKLKPWDTAAGSLIIEEAGGKITRFDGKTWNCFDINIMASNGRIHSEMLSVISKCHDDRS